MSGFADSLVLDARSDVPDRRDRIYRPSLGTAKAAIDPRRQGGWWHPGRVRNQGEDPSCTGHALAAAVDHLLAIERLEIDGARDPTPSLERLQQPYASAFMIYGNAQLHDEWDGEGYSGSSLRGALKGFQLNGLCSIETAAELLDQASANGPRIGQSGWRWYTNRLVMADARNVMLGAYYRVLPVLADMHCALDESRVLVATARIHAGWYRPDGEHLVSFDESRPPAATGYHAFAVIGYETRGWIVQNSWGSSWGDRGVAIWSYADWAHNIADVWALRLAAPIPDTFRYSVGMQGTTAPTGVTSLRERSKPTRMDVLGHMVPIEDGRLVGHGRYHHDTPTLMETVDIINRRHTWKKQLESGQAMAPDVTKASQRDLLYRHVLLYALGGTRDQTEAARLVRMLHPVFRANGIYPVFLTWDSGLWCELRKGVGRLIDAMTDRTDAGGHAPSQTLARLIEIEATGVPARLSRELERSMRRFFVRDAQDADGYRSDGIKLLHWMLKKLSWRHRQGGMSYHIATHDFGARFILELLAKYEKVGRNNAPVFSSLHLVSPLIDHDCFERQLVPYLTPRGEGKVNRRSKLDLPVIENTVLWHRREAQADRDRFHPGYPNSWPEFWARVMGLVRAREKIDVDKLDIVRTSGSARDFPVARSLALPCYAEALGKQAKRDGWAVQLRQVDGDGDAGPCGHADLDGTPQVINGMLESILGKKAVQRRLTSSEWRAAR